MTWNEFDQALKSGDIAPVYLFTGPEAFVKRRALERLREKLLPQGMEMLNDTTLEGVSARQIIDAAETLPMMCDRRIVTVRDWAPLLSEKSKDEDREVERIQAWLNDPPPGCVLVFYMRQNADGKKKLTGILRKTALVVDFQPLSGAELSRWCAALLKPRGKKLSSQAFNTLTFMVGSDLTRLSGELGKLADYVGDERSEITIEDVHAIVSPSPEYRVFEIMNHLLEGDLLGAQQIVNSMLQNGQKSIGIIAMLTRQVRLLLHIKCALDAGEPLSGIRDTLDIKDWHAKAVARQCAKLSADWLEQLYERCVSYDFEFKSGRLREQDALNELILQIGLASERR